MTEKTTLHPLKTWRLAEGKSQAWCAAQCGVTRQTWIEWENAGNVPSARSMVKVLRLTGGKVTADQIYQQIDEAA